MKALWTRFAAAAVLVLTLQAGLTLHEVLNVWQRGHIGYNSAAYHQAARNTLRYGTLLPAQYVTGREPGPKDLYTHAPLALHLHTVGSLALFGDERLSVRLVPVVHGILAALALLLVAQRLYGWRIALVASVVYVLLPINSIYGHMSNHSTGFIFWSLAWLYSYLRYIGVPAPPESRRAQRAWGVALFGTGLMAMQWDWPAYYVAFAIAVHWLYVIVTRRRAEVLSKAEMWRELGLLAAFCVVVLVSFASFFWLVASEVGGFQGIIYTYKGRSAPVANVYSKLWALCFSRLFSAPIMVLSAAWLIGWGVRLFRGRARAVDLVPVSFAFAGITHTLLFKRTTLIHKYWPWPLHPFVAIATACALFWLSARAAELLGRFGPLRNTSLEARSAWLTGVVLAGFFAFYAPFALRTFEDGRSTYGNIDQKAYDGGYLQMRFGEKVNAWTSPDTLVLTHPAFGWAIHFKCTVDRAMQNLRRGKGSSPADPRDTKKPTVFIGGVRETPRAQLVAAAAGHPYRQYGLYYFVDLRTSGSDVRIWDLYPLEASLAWKYWVNPVFGPHEERRNAAAETKLLAEIAALRSAEHAP